MIHPGQILREQFFTTTKQSVDFITYSNICPNIFSNLLQEKINIDKYIAQKLAIYFDTSEEYWLNIQKIFDNRKDKL